MTMSDVREVADAHADLADGFDDFDRDFEPTPLVELVAERLARNEPRSHIASALGITVAEVAAQVAVAMEGRRQERGTAPEQIFALHLVLDEVQDGLYAALSDPSRHDRPTLLRLQLEALRVRTELFTAERAADAAR